MTDFLRPLLTLIVVAVGASGLTACALSRSVIDLPPAAPTIAMPPAGIAKIVEIRDRRTFDVNPSDPSRPSLGSADEIKDPAITSRAIGRKRNAYGQALGDVVLPENRTVVDVVREAARRALQERGWAVVEPASGEYARALPLSLDVDQFWAWFTPGFWAVTVRFVGLVEMTGDPLIGATSSQAAATSAVETGAAFESVWAETITKGVEDLTAKMKERIRTPAEVPR